MKISYDGRSVVTVTEENVTENFGDRLMVASEILSYFPSRGGSRWGTDGIGYAINKEKGLIEVHQSGVGPINYKKVLEVVRTHIPRLTVA